MLVKVDVVVEVAVATFVIVVDASSVMVVEASTGMEVVVVDWVIVDVYINKSATMQQAFL